MNNLSPVNVNWAIFNGEISMQNILKELLKIANSDTNAIITGFEDSGKATFVEALTKSFNVQKFLQIRENLQNVNTHVIVSNNNIVDEDKLYALAKFRKQTVEDFDDDRTFESVIYDAIKSFAENQSSKQYQKTLIENLRQEFFSEKPHSFYYKLGIVDDDVFTKLVHILFKIDTNFLLNFWNSATEEERNNKEVFAASLHDYVKHVNSLCTIHREFYTLAAKCSNHNISKCINKLKNTIDANVKEVQSGYFQLVVSIDPNPNNRLEFELLLNDWAGGCWNLFYDITLVFYGNPDILGKQENLHFFVTADLDSSIEDASRTLAKCANDTKCTNIIFLVDSTKAHRDLDKLIEIFNSSETFIQNEHFNTSEHFSIRCKTNLSIIFTNFDRCILNFTSQHTSCSKFDDPYNCDWINVEEGYQYADQMLCDFSKQCKNSLQKINLVNTLKAMLNTLGTNDTFISECSYPKVIKRSIDYINGNLPEILISQKPDKIKFLDAF